ncbi:hypothetical protein ANN_25147 [Periplaneta americana]|uniref:C2H2-type domain-containing protein n=1 Tax=Periplaneta americana TaxID=6978 RepID=A0ABQ8S0I9_PERAM|nr:hypothetical protein ANN_25147 [Periplaneta americana]
MSPGSNTVSYPAFARIGLRENPGKKPQPGCYDLDDLSQALLTPVAEWNMEFCMHRCEKCGRSYRHRENLLRHIRVECGKEAQFYCIYCKYKTKHKNNLLRHLRCRHQITC